MATKPKPKPIRYGPPEEKRSFLKIIIFLLFILVAISTITWLIKSNPRQHALTCQTGTGFGSWGAMGRCTED